MTWQAHMRVHEVRVRFICVLFSLLTPQPFLKSAGKRRCGRRCHHENRLILAVSTCVRIMSLQTVASTNVESFGSATRNETTNWLQTVLVRRFRWNFKSLWKRSAHVDVSVRTARNGFRVMWYVTRGLRNLIRHNLTHYELTKVSCSRFSFHVVR